MCYTRIELPVMQTVSESLRDVFQLDALDADERLVGADGIADIETLVGGKDFISELKQRRVLVFADSELLLRIRYAALQLVVVGLGLLCVAGSLCVSVLVLSDFHLERARARRALPRMGELDLCRGKLRLQRVALLLRSGLRRLQRSLLVLRLVQLVERRAQLIAQPVLERLRTDGRRENRAKQPERKCEFWLRNMGTRRHGEHGVERPGPSYR